MKRIYLSVYFILFHTLPWYASNPTPTTKTGINSSTTLHNHEPLSAFSAIKMPIAFISDDFTKQVFAQIDETFGKSGLNLDDQQIVHLKNSYFYLIFLAKLEKIQNDPAFKQYQTDFAPYLHDNSTALPHIPSNALVASSAWNSIIITTQDLQNSTAWQMYCKTMICDIYAYYSIVLQVIHNVEKQTFNYIPHFETSFYNSDYTDLRTLNEMSRTRLVLENNIKARWLTQCYDWKNLATVATTPKKNKNATLEFSIVSFRKSKFYTTIRNMYATLSIPNQKETGTPISNEQILSAQKLTSPLKEYVWCYYMLYEASGQLTSSINAQNLEEILATCSTNKIVPNIFPYTSDDYILLEELLATKSKAENSHTNSLHPSATQYKSENLRKPAALQQTYRNHMREVQNNIDKINNTAVQAQMWSFFSDLGHFVSSAFNDIKNGVEAAAQAALDVTKAAGEAFLAVTPLGATIQLTIALAHGTSILDLPKDIFQTATHQAINDLEQATQGLNNSIDDFGSSLKDGIIAPFAEIQGDLAGFILDDQKLGADISSVIDNVSGSLVDIMAQVTKNIADQPLEAGIEGVEAAQIGEQLATTVATAAWAIFSQQGREEFLQQGKELGQDCLSAITQSYANLENITKSSMAVVLKSLGVIVNAITTIFIDLCREVTYLFTGGIFNLFGGIASKIPGLDKVTAFSQQTANHVTNTLEAHRQTINQVMGVVACVAADVAVDIASGGAGTVADAAIDEAIFSGAEATIEETSAEVASQAAKTAEELASQVKNAEQELASLPEDASQEDIVAAEQKVKQAQQAADQAAQKAETLAKQAKDAQQSAAQKVAQKVAQKTQAKIQQTADDIKSFAKGFAKTSKNLLKSNEDIAEQAADYAQDVKNAQTAAEDDFNAAQKAASDAKNTLKQAFQDGKQDAISDAQQAVQKATKDLQSSASKLKQLNQELKEAQQAEQLTAKIVQETTGQTVKRYGQNVLKTLGTALKPVGFIMNVTFNLGSIIGGYNADAKNAIQETEQSQAVNNLWAFFNANKIATAQQQISYLEEMDQKIQAQIGNQALALALNQNLINSNLLNLRQAMAAMLAPLYAQLLTPDPTTGLLPADIGALWKIKTDYISMYPSQSFFTTTTGRSDFPFAQEIAQSPEISTPLIASAKKSTISTGPDKFWFNQRCTARDNATTEGTLKKPTDPLLVQVDLQFLYTLNSGLHVGLYLGGNYHDYTSAGYVEKFSTPNPAKADEPNINSDIVDLDEAHLAKMIVLYRDQATDALSFGIYEHEGLGWIVQQTLPTTAQLDKQHIYTVQAMLNATNLQVELFVDHATTPIVSQTVSVSQLQNQRTYGIISSGAAIEWDQIKPIPTINSSVQEKTTATSEVMREQQNKVVLAQALNPTFGVFKLTALSKQAILLGQYLYATTNTGLKKILSKPTDNATDFVIFGTHSPTAPLNFGIDPQTALQNPNAVIISVINGAMYNAQGESIGNIANAWNQYQTTFGPFSTQLNTFITAQQATINAAVAHVKFGSFILDIISKDNTGQPITTAIANGQYIYSCTQTLLDNQGKPIKDSTGRPIIDYMVMANITNNNLTIGMAPTASNANALFSFITGNIYLKNTTITPKIVPKPSSVNQFNSAMELGSVYAAQFGLSTSDPIFTTITQAMTNYAAYQKTAPTTAAPAPSIANKPNVLPAIQAQQQHTTGVHLIMHGQTIGASKNAPSGINILAASKLSLDQRQKLAAGGKQAGYQIPGVHLSFHKKN